MVINVLQSIARKMIQGPHPEWKGLRNLIPVLQKMIPAHERNGPSASAGIRIPADLGVAKRKGICVPAAFSGHIGNQLRRAGPSPVSPEISPRSKKKTPLIPLHESERGSASRVLDPICRRA
jgi:hypothetical protein